MSEKCSGKSVGGIREDGWGNILMIYRRYEPRGWACPAGHIEEGEHVQGALIKEFNEEVGLKVVGMEQLFHENVPWNNCHRSGGYGHEWWVFKAFCLGEVQVGEEETVIDSKTGKSWGWFSREEIQRLELEPVWRYWFEKLGYIKPQE
jgi:ADP-ribose pyrophosphatase YjhB (NUDIX family)